MIFRTEEDVTNWVNQNYSEKELQRLNIFPAASSEVPRALIAFKGISYKAINEYLRKNPDGTETNEKLCEFQNCILERCIPTDVTVYRYVTFKEELWLNFSTQRGKICSYHGFLSTTLLEQRYRELHPEIQGRSVIEIQVPKGANGVYLPEVNPTKPDFEVIFPHKTKLECIGVNKYKIVAE